MDMMRLECAGARNVHDLRGLERDQFGIKGESEREAIQSQLTSPSVKSW